MKDLIVTGRILPISESTKRRNPKLYGAPLGAVEDRQHAEPPRALERNAQAQQSRKSSVAVSVDIIGVRRRKLDDDNFAAGAKPLRDAIAASLYIDDGSERIRFHYGQSLTDGPEGTIVRIAWV